MVGGMALIRDLRMMSGRMYRRSSTETVFLLFSGFKLRLAIISFFWLLMLRSRVINWSGHRYPVKLSPHPIPCPNNMYNSAYHSQS